MRKKLTLFLCLFILFGFKIVYADSNVYVNYYGIEIKNDDYDKMKKYYSESFIYTMNSEEYDSIMKNNLTNIKVDEYVYYDTNAMFLYSIVISTSYKTLRIVNNNGYITISLKWTTMPKTRSYDVIAARFSGVNISGIVNFKQTYIENGKTYISTTGTRQNFSNGLGYSFKLSTKDHLESDLSFWISGSGKVYASYQHAQKNVSLEQSKSYVLSSTGYGGVILFNDDVKIKYDAMSGVSLSI